MNTSPLHASASVLIGGSFDPVHLGHLWLAEQVAAALPCAQIAFLPTAGSPLKHTQTSAKHRRALLRLALRDTPFRLNASEIGRSQPVYTIDTLRELRQQLDATQPLIFVMGQDSLDHLHRWKDHHALLHYTHFWVFARAGSAQPLRLPDALAAHQVQQPAQLCQSPAGRVYVDLRVPPAISSTLIRQHLATSRALVPKRIWAYNRKALLYGSSSAYEY